MIFLGQEDQMRPGVPASLLFASLPQQVYNLQWDPHQIQRHQGVESVEYAISEDHRGWQAGVLFWSERVCEA